MAPEAARQLRDICRRFHVRRLAIFGSASRGEASPASDVDLLVDFEEGHHPGWDIILLEDELSEVFDGRRIDLVNRKYLKPRLRDSILRSARDLYESSHAA